MNNLIGQYGELLAINFLKKKGYIIKERNFKRKWGEIDIIAYDRRKKEWVFVEVKTRNIKEEKESILPEDELTFQKLKRLKKIILSYLSFKGIENKKWRFDFIGIELKEGSNKPDIRHYENEFIDLL